MPAESFGIKDWLMIGATLMGPVLAVQAQKWLERWREFDAGKRRLFATLMATRAERVSPEHVRALNMIDITYSGAHRFLGLNIGKPSRQEKVIVDKWRTYLDMLDPNAGASAEKRDEGFNAILRAMAEHLSYDFNDVLLRRGAYYPSAHVDQESEHKDIRAGLLRMLTGKQKLSVELETTRNDELSIAYAEALGKLNDALDSGRLLVQVAMAPPTEVLTQTSGPAVANDTPPAAHKTHGTKIT